METFELVLISRIVQSVASAQVSAGSGGLVVEAVAAVAVEVVQQSVVLRRMIDESI